MELINLDPIPSQRFNITLGDNNYDIKIYSIDGAMAYDLDINSQRLDNNGVWLVSGFVMVNDVLLLPYVHQELNGNLLLALSEDDTPDYTRFGTAQFLYYLDAAETEAYRTVTRL